MNPTTTFPTNPNLTNSNIHTTNTANHGPLSVENSAQEIHLFSSPYNSPPQMITPRINPAETLKGISQLHSKLDEMLKSSSKIQSIEQAPSVGITLQNNVIQREFTRPNSVQVSYRSEVLEKFSQVPINLSGFPLSPKVEAFPTFSGAETPSLINSAPIYDKNKLEHILSNIKSREVVHHVNSPQLHIDPTGFQGRPQPQVQSVMSPYARPQEFVRPPMDPYAQVPNGHPGFSSPHAYPQNIPHQQQQQHGNFYHPATMQPNQIQSPRQVQSPTAQYAENPYYQAPQMEQQMRPQAQYAESPYYQAPQMEQQMRAPYAEPRGHPQFDPRMYQQVQIPQVYEREIPEEFGELEADEEEYERESQQRRQVREPVSQQKSHHGFRSGNKRNLQRRQEEEEQEPEQREDCAFWGQVQNDEDSLIIKHHPVKQESSRKNNRQTNENLFGELEDDSTDNPKPVQKKTQSKQKTNKGGRSKRRGARNPETAQRIIPDDIFTEPVVEQGPQIEGKVTGGRARRNSRKRFPLFKGEEPTQTKTNAMEPTEPVTPPVQIFGQEFRSGGSISKKGSPEKAVQTPKVRESTDYQLKERSPYTSNTIQPLTLAELERGLEISTASEIKKLHQDTLNQFETLSDFAFKGGNVEPESHNDSITKAFEHAKCQSPLKMSPPKRKAKETVALKTEMVFKNKDSRRRLVR